MTTSREQTAEIRQKILIKQQILAWLERPKSCHFSSLPSGFQILFFL